MRDLPEPNGVIFKHSKKINLSGAGGLAGENCNKQDKQFRQNQHIPNRFLPQ